MKKNFIILLSAGCLTLCSNLAFAVFSVSLTPSNHNGYSVSCFGGIDGAINITVSGGTSPYTYRWSTGATTQNVSALASGYYQVTVTDVNLATCSGNVTLTQPTALTLSVTPSIYTAQATNISCYNCCNGYVNISAGGGVTAYSYAWSSGQTTANVTNLCKNSYTIIVTDANGCSKGEHQVMTEPDKDTWTMTGNTGSNPSTQFIGNTDSVDMSFRTNNNEKLRMKANGTLKINRLADTISYSPIVIDSLGQLLKINLYDDNAALSVASPWVLGGNPFNGDASANYLGTRFDKALVFKTHANNTSTGGERMRIMGDGRVRIGTNFSNTLAQDFILSVRGKILAEEVHVQNFANWPDYVFSENYQLQSISELKEFIETENHLPGLPSAKTVEKEGFDLGGMQSKLLQKIEELTLYIIKQDERMDKIEKSNAALKIQNEELNRRTK